MVPIGLTRAGILVPIAALLHRVGAPVERLLAGSGLPEWVLTDPEAVIPTSATARLLAQAARFQGIQNVGLLSGLETRIEALGTYGRLVRESPTLGAALDALVAHHPTFSSNGRMWLVQRGADVAVCQAFTTRFDRDWEQASHYILMLMVGVVRLAAGPTWRPSAVTLQTGECAALRDAEPLSRARIDFAQPATSILVPGALLSAPLPPRAVADPVDVDAWATAAPARDLAGAVLQVIDTLSWDDYPNPQRTAAALGTSVRSLQRELAEAGVTHQDLVARVRCAAAAALLEQTDCKILDIALDLGYSDHAHFTRAFRRWMGCSPQEYRRLRTHASAGGALSPEPMPAGADAGPAAPRIAGQRRGR